MAEVNLTVRVVKPIWLPLAVFFIKFIAALRVMFTGETLTDQKLREIGDWYARQLRIVVQEAEPNPFRG